MIGAIAGHAAAGMSRDDLMGIGEALDAGQAGLVVVATPGIGAEVEAAMKKADKVETRQLQADHEQLAAEAQEADEADEATRARSGRRRSTRAWDVPVSESVRVAGPPPGVPPAKGMVWVPGGTFLMGSDGFYPEEGPVRPVAVGGFWIDEHPVTVAGFRRFVKATGYITVAERPIDPAEYPDADPDLLHPGSLVFHPAAGPVDLRDPTNWWAYVPGAQWRHPAGPGQHAPREGAPSRDACRRRGRRHLRSVGRKGRCRPRPNGNTQRVAASKERPTPGETSSCRRAG